MKIFTILTLSFLVISAQAKETKSEQTKEQAKQQQMKEQTKEKLASKSDLECKECLVKGEDKKPSANIKQCESIDKDTHADKRRDCFETALSKDSECKSIGKEDSQEFEKCAKDDSVALNKEIKDDSVALNKKEKVAPRDCSFSPDEKSISCPDGTEYNMNKNINKISRYTKKEFSADSNEDHPKTPSKAIKG